VRLSKAFERIEPKPIAAASIAQVHHAVLRDGREMALKIQRPGIREHVLDDLEALGEVAAFLDCPHRGRPALRHHAALSTSSANRCCASSISGRRRCTSSRSPAT